MVASEEKRMAQQKKQREATAQAEKSNTAAN